jgi:hypothetical protein
MSSLSRIFAMSCASQKSRIEKNAHVPMSEYTIFIRHISKIY